MLKSLSSKELFTLIYKKNLWGEQHSVSGPGSTLDSTKVIRKILPSLIKDLKVNSILDIPCRDFHWMQHVYLENIEYIGANIVDKIIQIIQTYIPMNIIHSLP